MTNPRFSRRLVLPSIILLLTALFALDPFGWAPSDPPRSAAPPLAAEPSAIAVATKPLGAEVAAPARSVPAPGSARGKAASPASPSGASRTAAPEEVPAVAGMVIGKDPETGTWGPPTAEQLRELAELRKLSAADRRAIAKPDGPLPEVRHPDGHVSVELDGQFQEFTTVRLGPDGKPVYTCVRGPENAERALSEPAAPALEER